MPAQDGLALHVLEAELAHVEAAEARVLLGVGRVVPRVQLVAPERDGLDHVAALGDLPLQPQLLLREPKNSLKAAGGEPGFISLEEICFKSSKFVFH